MSLFPLRTARRILVAIKGCCSVVLEPITKIASAFSSSPIEFVMAPLPKEDAKPTTVLAWHRRAQWSTLFVPNTALANF